MDKSEAQFILQSFRPDGADAHDPAFAEALSLAAEDRELGAWLARERATDAAFASALDQVEIPDDLRDQILTVLTGGVAGEFSEMDAVFVGALAAVRPPEGLRDQILAAMSAGRIGEEAVSAKAAPQRVSRWLKVAAVAAMIALGAFLAVQVTSGPKALQGTLTAHDVEQFAIQTMEAPVFTLDERDRDPLKLVSWLSQKGLPTPGELPPQVERASGIGCKVLDVNEKKAALVCYELSTGEIVHLVVLDRSEIVGALPPLGNAPNTCHGCKKSGWASVAWEEDGKAMILLGKMDAADLKKAF